MTKAHFIIDNVWTRVVTDDDALDILDAAFSYLLDGYRHMQAYKTGKWDGKKHLLSKLHRFPTGLLGDAKKLLSDYTITETDNRVRPDRDTRSWNLRGADEREHQMEAIVMALEEGRGIIWHSTGSGKTEVMAGIIQMLDLPAIVMVNQALIAEQTAERLAKRIGKKVGLYSSGKRRDGQIVVATFQTLQSKLKDDKENQTQTLRKWLAQYQVLAIDEAHHTLARTYQEVINECPAYYRFAFSATPEKTQDKGARLHIVGSTGPVLDTFTAGEGVEAGLLVRADVTMLHWHQDKPKAWWKAPEFEINDRNYTYTGKKTQLVDRGDGKMIRVPLAKQDQVPGLYETAIVKNDVRNSYIVDGVALMLEDERQVLVLVERIDHGLMLKKRIERECDVPVLFMQGSDSSDIRATKKRQFSDEGYRVMIATTIMDEGVDLPAIDGLVLAAGGKAQHRIIQRLGRGMRPKEGKDSLVVLDFMDTNSATMWRHSKERRKVYKSDAGGYHLEETEINAD
jgi:superfamily II DNA or RNA helicase